MAWEGMSFNLFTDTALTTVFSGTISLAHKTDFSDNPQDTVLYLGSTNENRRLQASSSPGIANITLTPADILPEWDNATAYIEGDKIQPVSGNTFVYRCTTAGTSGGSEPTWPTSGFGTTVVDNTAVWELYADHHPATEIKLALTSLALGSATGGAALNIATTVDGGTSNKVTVYVRVTNSIDMITNSTGNAEIGCTLNSVVETSTV